MGIQEYLWDFFCVYSVKIVGLLEYFLVDVVIEVVLCYVLDFDCVSICVRQSGVGKYIVVIVDVYFIYKE